MVVVSSNKLLLRNACRVLRVETPSMLPTLRTFQFISVHLPARTATQMPSDTLHTWMTEHWLASQVWRKHDVLHAMLAIECLGENKDACFMASACTPNGALRRAAQAPRPVEAISMALMYMMLQCQASASPMQYQMDFDVMASHCVQKTNKARSLQALAAARDGRVQGRMPDKWICGICLSDATTTVARFKCGPPSALVHWFCLACLRKWQRRCEAADQPPTCPTCRTPFVAAAPTSRPTLRPRRANRFAIAGVAEVDRRSDGSMELIYPSPQMQKVIIAAMGAQDRRIQGDGLSV